MAQSTKRERNPYPAIDPFSRLDLLAMSPEEIAGEWREWLLDHADASDRAAAVAENKANEHMEVAVATRAKAAKLREVANGC